MPCQGLTFLGYALSDFVGDLPELDGIINWAGGEEIVVEGIEVQIEDLA